MKNYMVEICIVDSKGPKVKANKTASNSMIFISIFVKNCLLYDAWLRTVSIPADFYRFRSHTGGKIITLRII